MIEKYFSDIAAMGLFVNNLFQRHDGKWQANLRDSSECYEFGRGESPMLALNDAIEKAKISLTTQSLDDMME